MSAERGHGKPHENLFDIGIKNRREVVGNAYVDAALKNGSSEFAYPGQQLVTEYVRDLPHILRRASRAKLILLADE